MKKTQSSSKVKEILKFRIPLGKASKEEVKPKTLVAGSKTKPQKQKITNKNLFSKRSGTRDEGKHYEVLMVAKLILECIKNDNIQNFKISSNGEEFGTFDDVVLEIKSQDQIEEKWALQLKYNQVSKDGNFKIQDYLKCFQGSKDSIHDSNLILMTNLKFNARDGTKILISDGENFHVKSYRTAAKELLNTSEKKKYCYRFEIVRSGTISPFSKKLRDYEEFFKRFFLYADRVNVDDIEKCVAKKFKRLFGCHQSFSDKYIKFIEKWSEREGIKDKLDKSTMQKVIAIHLLSPFIHPFSFGPINENAKILGRAIGKFTISAIDENSLEKCQRLWGDAKDILEKTDIKQINRIIRKYELNFDAVENLNNLSSKEYTQLLWFMDMKIPLIVSETPLTYEAINLCKDRSYVLIRDGESSKFSEEYTTFEKLSDLIMHSDIMNQLTMNFKCKLPGNEFSLDYLIQENRHFLEIITTNELLEMVENPYVVIQEAQEKLPVPYIPRYLSIAIINSQYLRTVEDNVSVLLSNVEDEEARLQDYDRRLDRRLQLIESIGNILSDVKKYRIHGSSIDEALFYDPDKDNKINIIIDEPGMGKSVFLKSLKNKLSSTFWTILLLPKDISEICCFVRSEKNRNKIDNFIIELKYPQYKEIDKLILRVLMENGKIACLWDALDEISGEDLTTVSDLIHGFFHWDTIHWITSRHHLKETLEDKFNTFSFKISTFNDDQQTYYIHNRLKEIISDESTEDITETIKNNLEFAANIEILGIPLLLFMLTELFLQNEETYSNLKNQKLLSLTDLYGLFVEEKFNTHYKTANNIVYINPQRKEILEIYQKDKIKNYTAAAMKMFFDEDFVSKLNIRYSQNGNYVAGITVDSKNVQFVHNSYAEYFAALYFSENYKNIPGFENILFHKKHTNIRYFFDCLLARDSLPHVTVLNRSLTNLKKYKDRLTDCKDLGGRSLLHLAASWGKMYSLFPVYQINDSIYQIGHGLIDLKVKTPKYDQESLEYLLEESDVSEQDHLFKWNCLSYAEKSGCLLNTIIIENCKEMGYLNSKDYKLNCNILFYSSLYGYKCIIESHKSLNQYNVVTIGDQNLLHVACINGHFEIVNFLFKSGVDINATDVFGYTPLHYAAEYGHYNVVEELITYGAIIDFITSTSNDPIDEMLYKHQEQHVEKTEELSSDIASILAPLARSPIDIAIAQGDDPTAVSETNLGSTSLPKLSFYRRLKIMNSLKKFKATFNLDDKIGVTPLYIASQNGHQDVVKLLIKCGAVINEANKNGSTSLHAALQNGHQDVVQLLINSGATVNLADKNGSTPLHAACRSGHQEFVQLLINSEAAVNLVDNDGSTPLHAACRSGHQEVVQLLINSEAAVNVVDNDGSTPLYTACQTGHQDVAQLLINSGETVNLANKKGYTPLYAACKHNRKNIVQLLINSKATVDLADEDGFTPLYAACQNGHQDVVQLLIDSGATVNLADKHGFTPLHAACQSGHRDVVQLLLIDSGATVNLGDRDGNTPLHLACENGHRNVVQLLIDSGATVNLANVKGYTPLRAACFNGHQEIAQLLIDSGATGDLSNLLLD